LFDSASEGARLLTPPMLVVALGGDTTSTPWPLSITRTTNPPVAVVLDDDPDRRGGTDRTTIGRAYPGGTYVWFLPQGTRTFADMRISHEVRLRLSRDAVAWVPIADVHPAAAADDPRTAVMGSPVLAPESLGVRLRIPLTHAVPLSVSESERGMVITLYGAVSNANLVQYGANQRLVRQLTWTQDSADRLELTLAFDRSLWGWRDQVDGSDLVFDFRVPPAIDMVHPLRGRTIVVDPGHPPGGACGPTGLCEPEANLAVAREVGELLVAGGARVIMTRKGMEPVDLWPRVALADSVDADLLISIHANALPDGTNPFVNSGTSTYFNHLQSLELARAVQRAMVAELGLRDLGVFRGDLALARPTWYPAVLTEGLFLMFPEQEAALRSGAGRRRYASGIVGGITAFLQQVGRAENRAP
jgi:N-acetylmuramoyl-L-alanine amidase